MQCLAPQENCTVSTSWCRWSYWRRLSPLELQRLNCRAELLKDAYPRQTYRARFGGVTGHLSHQHGTALTVPCCTCVGLAALSSHPALETTGSSKGMRDTHPCLQPQLALGPFRFNIAGQGKPAGEVWWQAARQQQFLKDKEAAEARARAQEGGIGARRTGTPHHTRRLACNKPVGNPWWRLAA